MGKNKLVLYMKHKDVRGDVCRLAVVLLMARETLELECCCCSTLFTSFYNFPKIDIS